MNRGEIWTLQDGGYASKARPVIILQSQKISDFNSVILCLFTTFNSENIPTRIKIEPNKKNKLNKTSYIMTEKLITVDKNLLGEKIGELENEQMHLISKSLAKLLEISKDDIENVD